MILLTEEEFMFPGKKNSNKVLLVLAPMETGHQDIFPVGLGILASVLRKEGLDVTVSERSAGPITADSLVGRILDGDYFAVGVSGMSAAYGFMVEFGEKFKKTCPDIPLVAGGIMGAGPGKRLLLEKAGVDYVAVGEGEITAARLFKRLASGRNGKDIPGLYYLDHRGMQYTGPPEICKNFDDVPFPAYDLFDMEKYIRETSEEGRQVHYFRSQKELEEMRAVYFEIGRGCSGKCSFCFRHFNRVVQHSVDYLMEHVKFLHEHYGINTLRPIDEHFIVSRRWLETFCDAVEKLPFKLYFNYAARLDKIEPFWDIHKRLRQIGGVLFTVNPEAGAVLTLKSSRKGFTIDTAIKGIRLAKTLEPNIYCSMVWGLPGESIDTIAESMRFISDIDINIERVSRFMATPFPDTELYKIALEKHQIPDEEQFLLKLRGTRDYLINFSQFPTAKHLEAAVYSAFFLMAFRKYLRKGDYRMLAGSIYEIAANFSRLVISPKAHRFFSRTKKYLIKKQYRLIGQEIVKFLNGYDALDYLDRPLDKVHGGVRLRDSIKLLMEYFAQFKKLRLAMQRTGALK
jgi:anaerobic magnesium-protoporphyrin IX monomethyl ester cyclase